MRVLSKFKRAASRILFLSALTVLLFATANAYTIVMRGGRRIEIPSRFVVTPSTLTYEVSPGVQITLEMATIDVAATEKANKEVPGSLLKRAQPGSEKPVGPTDNVEKNKAASEASGARGARRTITNRDLEEAARRRRESERAYENRIKELGLPSLEESRSRAAASSELIQSELEQKRFSERESESYWRARASALRTEIAALDAEIDFIRMKLEEVSSPTWTSGGSFTSVVSVLPFINFGGRRFGSSGDFRGGRFGVGSGIHGPGIVMGPQGGIVMGPQGGSVMGPVSGAQMTGRVGFGGGNTRGHIFLNPGNFPHSRTVVGYPVASWPVTVFGSSVPYYDFSYERGELITRFNELGAARAGLSARWRELEEEARRAGAPPGWLRP
jgi:hypothetical protein